MCTRVSVMAMVIRYLLVVFALSLCWNATVPAKPLLVSNNDKSAKVSGANSRLNAKLDGAAVLLKPNVSPSDVHAGSGKQTVRFSVPLLGKASSTTTVYLRRQGDKRSVAMKETGKRGAGDREMHIWVADVQVDTNKVNPDSCLRYEAFIKHGRGGLVSPASSLCVTSFPVKFAESNIVNPVVFSDGSKAVADEILLTATPSISATAIRQLARSINADVVGSLKSMNLYQLKLSSPLKANQLREVVSSLKTRPGVVNASINAIGSYAYTPNDNAFNLPPSDVNSQHGLKLVLAHNQATGNAWDANARGSGVTVVVMDSGLDLTHPDLDPTWTCQSSAGPVLVPCADPVGHGTEVAGVVAAKTDNGQGIAGVAFNSKIHSIQVSTNTNVLASQMISGFQAARDYVALHPEASVVNASFYAAGGSATPADWAAVCTAIEQVGFNGVARAVIVNAVGNNNLNATIYPARCKDLNPELVHKDLLITVSNSTSVVDASCGSVPVDQRCNSSNFGAWVDVAAPGSMIRTTTTGGAYISQTGNSFSAPLVSGAAAILRSCNTPIVPEQIRATLTASANVTVPYPSFGANPAGTTPRLDIHRALSYRPPTGIALTNTTIYEKNAPGTTIGLLSATDPDSCDVFTYTLVNGAGTFSITGNTLSINNAANYANQSLYNIQVRATDFGGLWIEQPFTVNVLNVNDAPSGSNGLVTTSEDTTYTFSAADFGFSDPLDTPSNNLSEIIVITSPALGTLSLSGASVTQPVPVASLGNLTFLPAANANGTPYTSFTFQVVDDGGIANSGVNTDPTPKTLTINVAPVNDAPVAANDTLSNVAEDSGTRTIPFAALTGNDDDGDPEVVQTLTIIAVGNAVGGMAMINGTNVEFTPNTNFNGTASFDYTVQDNGQTNGVNDFKPGVGSVSFAVTPVNDVPSFVPGADQTVPENAGLQTVTGWASAISAGPADEAGQALNFIISVPSNPGLFSVPPAITPAGDLIYTPAMNTSGSATITVQLHDDGGTANGGVDMSAPQTFTINVTHVPVPPSGVVGINGIRQISAPQPSLHADASGVNNPDNWSISHYQWRKSVAPPPGDTPVSIAGATNVDYQLVQADVGEYMSVCATYTDPVSTEICSGTDTVAVGDPHISTVDGLHYDFQSAGEFVSLRNSSGMEIQVRQTPVSTATPLTDAYSGLTSGVSVNSAVAARVGKHRVTYQADPNNNTASGAPVLRVDGVVTSLQAGGIDFEDGGRVTPQASGIQIDFPDQTTLIVSSGQWINNVWWMHLSVYHTSAYEGIMGARIKGSWLPRLPDGTAFGNMPTSLHDRYVQLYGKFADSWRVTDKTSLFDYAEGTSTATFTNKAWPTESGPYVAGTGPVAQPLGRNVAMQACRDVAGKNEKADCVFDVMVMGNKNIAKGHLLNQKIRLGAVNVVVRPVGKPNARGEMVVAATVVRHATVVPKVKGVRAVPAGMVQFMLGDKPLGKPVKLDAKGQAKLVVTRQNLERFNTGKLAITAQYQPARDKANVFLPGISRKLTRELAPTAPVVRGNR